MAQHTRIMSVAQWTGSGTGAWRAELPHSSPDHALIWITRGQGKALVEGVRRGLTTHTVLCIPARTLFALELGKQSFGTVCLIPAGGPILMPDQPTILRIRDVQAQAELTGILEALQREQAKARVFSDEAMDAHGTLLTVWLRRAIIDHQDETPEPTTSQRLAMAYAALIERDYSTGKPMADYARTLGVTPTHLTRVCRACAGLTASDLLTRRIVHAVRDLLQKGEHPANRVAAMLGFRSAAYFSRFVQHHTGKTPSALRKGTDAKPAPAKPAAPASSPRFVSVR